VGKKKSNSSRDPKGNEGFRVNLVSPDEMVLQEEMELPGLWDQWAPPYPLDLPKHQERTGKALMNSPYCFVSGMLKTVSGKSAK